MILWFITTIYTIILSINYFIIICILFTRIRTNQNITIINMEFWTSTFLYANIIIIIILFWTIVITLLCIISNIIYNLFTINIIITIILFTNYSIYRCLHLSNIGISTILIFTFTSCCVKSIPILFVLWAFICTIWFIILSIII